MRASIYFHSFFPRLPRSPPRLNPSTCLHPSSHRLGNYREEKGRILIFNWFIAGLRVSMALLLPVEVLLFWHHIISCHYCPRVGRGGNASWGLGLWKLHKYTFETQSCGVEQKLACLWHNVKCFISTPTCVAFTCLTLTYFLSPYAH